MSKPRLDAIEYIRGISMLGVIGIHVGSYYLENPYCHSALVALFEIVTRFSVPIFFFISAFGLFYNMDMSKAFDYKSFLVRRYKTVVVPYVVWSLFYIFHYVLLWQDTSPLKLVVIMYDLFFGLANYQLYFMVLLIWFYLLMPVWVWMVRRMNLCWLGILLVLQIVANYWICFEMNIAGVQNIVLKTFLMHHLNYWVIHYVFIFVLGGYLAVHMDEFMEFMRRHRSNLVVFFWLTLAGHLGYYIYLILYHGYTPLEGTYTAHQLCPTGVLYTLGASLFFFTVFTLWRLPDWLRPILHNFGKHSYFVYLAHPVFLTYCGLLLKQMGYPIVTSGIVLGLYVVVVALTMAAAVIFRRIGESMPVINMMTIGVYPKK